jgi:hypothetical protein
MEEGGSQLPLFRDKNTTAGFSVKIDPLIEGNFHIWYPTWRMTLESRGYWHHYIQSPPEVFKDSELIIRNDIFLAILYNVTAPFKSLVLQHRPDASAAWKALEDRFYGQSNAKISMLKFQLSTLTYDHKKGMQAYFSTLRDLWTQILNLGDDYKECEVVQLALRNVPKEYDSITDSLRMQAKCTLSLAEQMLIMKEHTLNQRHQQEHKEVAMSARFHQKKRQQQQQKPKFFIKKNFFGPNCWHCDDPGHQRPECAEYLEELNKLKNAANNNAVGAVAQAMAGMVVRPRRHVAELPY